MSGRGKEKIKKSLIRGYVLTLLIIFFDQLSKYFITVLMARGDSISILKGFFQLTLVYNTGAAFGILQTQSLLFEVLAVLAVVFINYLLLFKPGMLNCIERISLFFILAGTIGNLIDRLRLGYVIDFLDFRVWPVFNIADCFISIGAVLLGCAFLKGAFSGHYKKQKK